MRWVLGISLGMLAYIYAGYPLWIWGMSRWRSRPVRKGPFEGGVSVLLAAHNEAGILPEKVKNLLDLSRSEPIREIWIGLDGCTDGTGEAIREQVRISNPQYSITNIQGDPRSEGFEVRGSLSDEKPVAYDLRPAPEIHILAFDERRGKAAVLNDLMARAAQSVLVMMDARQRIEAGAISRLLEPFADPQVGVVSGALVYESAIGGAQKGAESYWGYEKFIRGCESRYWAVPGATGALYAIRRDLCEPIPENTLVDDVLIPMRAVLNGFRCLFEPAARVWDRPSEDFRRETIRKRRTLAGIWQMMRLEPRVNSVRANPIWFLWVSHKVLRLLTPALVFISWLAAGGMAGLTDEAASEWSRLLFWGLTVAIGLSGLAHAVGRRLHARCLGLLGAFWGVNLALVQAAWDAWTGRFEAKWRN